MVEDSEELEDMEERHNPGTAGVSPALLRNRRQDAQVSRDDFESCFIRPILSKLNAPEAS
jgi:hypothetical protein